MFRKTKNLNFLKQECQQKRVQRVPKRKHSEKNSMRDLYLYLQFIS